MFLVSALNYIGISYFLQSIGFILDGTKSNITKLAVETKLPQSVSLLRHKRYNRLALHMDKFQSHKAPHRLRGTVDGIIAGGKPRQARSAGLLKGNHRSSKANTVQPRLDNFKASNGYHPIGQPKLQTHSNSGSLNRRPRRNAHGQIDMTLSPASASYKNKSKRRWLKISLRSTAAFATILILFAGVFFGNAYWKSRHVLRGGSAGAAALDSEVDPTKLKGEGDGRINILLLGKGGPGHDGPDLTDTVLIASIDPVQKQAALLSIPRDFYVKTDYGWTKINSVYANAKYAVLT